jgi:YYY domain-containing protein
LSAVPLAAVFVLATRAAFIPYLENYGTAYNSLGLWMGERTPLWPYISVYALFVVPLAGFGVAQIARAAASRRGPLIALASAGLTATAALFLLGVEAAMVAIPMLCICAARILDRDASLHERAAWALAAGAFALTLFVEFFTLKGDIGRMNTVFKFYAQAWLMLGVATAVVAAAGLTEPLQRRARRAVRPALGSALPRTGFALLTAVVVFLAALYPVFAIPAKIADRYAPDAPAGLDGLAYMRFATRIDGPPNGERVFPLRYDYEAIRWMQANITGSPVIIEAGTGGLLYRWGARFSIYTGLPAVVGWDWHQRQQRAALTDRVVLDRQVDVDQFYNTDSVDRANILLARYNIRFVVVGDLEAAYYAPAGLEKFERMAELGYLRRAYANEGTRIYAVVE